jgi:hypothetical protein
MRRILLPLLALAASACAAPAAPAKGPENAPATPDGDVFAVTGTVREEWLPLLKPPVIDPAKTKLEAPPAGLTAPPASCAAWAARKPEGKAKCGDAAAALLALDAAMAQPAGDKRDVALSDLEGCAGLPVGAARALRAENAPLECGETLAAPLLEAPPAQMTGLVYHALLGQAIASRLGRAGQGAPALAPPYDKARVLAFHTGPLAAWFTQQAVLVHEVSRAAAELPYYAQGIAAIEAGMADLRVVEAMRAAPIPDEFQKDEALKNEYYGALEQRLDARKDRGRNAALAGLKQLALVGIIHDARVDRARAMLSRMYGGRRVDALDALILPPLGKAAPGNVEERLAAALPTLYAGLLLDERAASRPATLRMFLEKGLPLPQRMALKGASLPPDGTALFARARLELGRMYWRASDFDQAAALASASRAAAPSEETTFLLALSLALRNGPEDAVDMFRKAPRVFTSPNVAALDALAKQGGRFAGEAAFDAAMALQLGAPESADAAYWSGLAARYRDAAGKLQDRAQRAVAEDRAKSAEALAQAVK